MPEEAPRNGAPEETPRNGVPEGALGKLMLGVLVAAPEDTVSGSKCPGMVMIEVVLRKQLRAIVKGEF
jgi:hypothetical protein